MEPGAWVGEATRAFDGTRAAPRETGVGAAAGTAVGSMLAAPSAGPRARWWPKAVCRAGVTVAPPGCFAPPGSDHPAEAQHDARPPMATLAPTAARIRGGGDAGPAAPTGATRLSQMRAFRSGERTGCHHGDGRSWGRCSGVPRVGLRTPLAEGTLQRGGKSAGRLPAGRGILRKRLQDGPEERLRDILLRRDGIGSETCFIITATGVSAMNGTCPVRTS